MPRRTPGCGPTFTIRAWSLRTVSRSESAPVSVATAVICFLPFGGWPRSLVMQDQMDVCPLARGVMLPVGSTPIHPITGRRLLLPSSHSRTSIGSPCGSLPLAGDVRGCHVPSQSQRSDFRKPLNLLKTKDLFFYAFVNIKPVKSMRYAFLGSLNKVILT